eukprot:1191406-Prorocentrum_minimum.AAC.1
MLTALTGSVAGGGVHRSTSRRRPLPRLRRGGPPGLCDRPRPAAAPPEGGGRGRSNCGRSGGCQEGVGRGAQRLKKSSRGRACGRREVEGGQEGRYQSSVGAREPQNPTKGEEYQRHPQGVSYGT